MGSLFLEYLKVLLAAAPVGGVVAISFMAIFREPLKDLIGRTKGVKFPGGEWSASQVDRAVEAEAAPANPLTVPGTTDPPADPGLTLDPVQQARLADLLRAERARAYFWEYRFLNFFLVPSTQRVLDWFASVQHRPTIQLYDDYWSSTIVDPEERRAVLDALLSHRLIQATGELLEITPKGHEYVQFRGPRGEQQQPATK